jgi:hypothetical protein
MSAQQSIEAFFAAWGEADAGALNAALTEVISSEISYLDPRTDAALTSADAVTEYVAMYSTMAPGATAKAAVISETGGVFRATVEFAMPDGMKQFGQYFIEADAAGKLTRMVGFVGTGAME